MASVAAHLTAILLRKHVRLLQESCLEILCRAEVSCVICPSHAPSHLCSDHSKRHAALEFPSERERVDVARKLVEATLRGRTRAAGGRKVGRHSARLP